MLRVSKLTDYGTVVMAQMAREPERVFSAASLAQAVGIPLSTVRKLLKTLAGRDLLCSSRGKQGGYTLARAPEEISLAEIIQALEGPVGLTECCRQAGLCQMEARCQIRHQWHGINGVIYRALQAVSLRELVPPVSSGAYMEVL